MVAVDTMRTLVTVAFSAFVTEWLCALHYEIAYIWRKKFCLLTAFFLGTRYITMANLILMMIMFHKNWSEHQCHRVYLLMPIFAMLGILCAEGICIIRIWSIHKRNILVLGGLGGLFFATAIIQCYAVTQYETLWDPSGACVAAGQGMWLSAFWIAPAVLDTVILVLAVIAVTRETRQFGDNRILTIILRDQFLYFCLVFAACIISGVFMMADSNYLQSLNNPPAITVSSIAATRIVLSLKDEGARHKLVSSGGQHSGTAKMVTTSAVGSNGGTTTRSMSHAGAKVRSWLQLAPTLSSSNGGGGGGKGSRHSGIGARSAQQPVAPPVVQPNGPLGAYRDLELGVLHRPNVSDCSIAGLVPHDDDDGHGDGAKSDPNAPKLTKKQRETIDLGHEQRGALNNGDGDGMTAPGSPTRNRIREFARARASSFKRSVDAGAPSQSYHHSPAPAYTAEPTTTTTLASNPNRLSPPCSPKRKPVPAEVDTDVDFTGAVSVSPAGPAVQSMTHPYQLQAKLAPHGQLGESSVHAAQQPQQQQQQQQQQLSMPFVDVEYDPKSRSSSFSTTHHHVLAEPEHISDVEVRADSQRRPGAVSLDAEVKAGSEPDEVLLRSKASEARLRAE